MGRFVLNENVYILAKVVEVDPSDSTRYRLQTNLGKFYATEAKDKIRSNPAEVFTAEELYAIFQAVANMSSADVQLCFGSGITNVELLLKAGFTIKAIREKYAEWQFGNELNKGDVVYYTPNNNETIICTIIAVIEGNVSDTATDNIYIVYSDEKDTCYQASREEIVPAYKRSEKVIQALSDLDEAAEEARKGIG